ncbi:type II secretion system protein GspD [Planctomicrobium piriforme]|uniref:type II secretion system protein GspD n=1 Tax=Planctomicrobium piriforme TaxID=1576369 RepID=UPI0011137472|nr:type II and III secretion system protein [Planctomicrobium piriforme]
MFRTYGLLLRGSLLGTSLWLGSQIHAQDPAGQTADPFAAPPRQGFQPAPEAGSALAQDDVNRRRVTDQLRQAKQKLQQGQREEALRLAARAAGMAQQWQITFAPNELSPQRLIAEIRASAPANGAMLAQGQSPNAVTPVAGLAPANPAAGMGGEAQQAQRELAQGLLRQAQQEIADGQYDAARSKIEQARGVDVAYGVFDLRPEHLLAELARRQPARAEGPSAELTALTTAAPAQEPMIRPQAAPRAATQATAKAQAMQLLTDAKAAMAQGHFNEARELALQAQQKDVAWGLLEENPEHLLAQLEQATNKQMITAAPVSGAAQEAQKTRTVALELLKQARVSLAEGQMEVAQAKASEAQNLNASYALFDDRPDLVMQEVRMLQARSMMQPQQAPAATAPTAVTGQQQKKQQALACLNQARDAMRSGDVATADKLVAQAESMDVAFGLFEDSPEVVREDLNRLVASRQGKPQSNMAAAAAPSAAPGMSREVLKQQAAQLLQAARQDMKAGRVAEARAKATQAATFDVTYDLFEDSPERLLTELAYANAPTVAGNAPAMPRAAAPNDAQLAMKQQALMLVQAARADLKAGRVAEARAKASQAATIDVAYELFEDSPERLLSDLETVSSKNVAANAMPATAAPSQALKQQAVQMVQAARREFKSGNIDAARSLAEQAATVDVTYDLFEDSPERLLNEMNLAARGMQSDNSVAAAPLPPTGTAAAPAADEASMKQQALSLLAAARAELKAGNVEAARAKATQAATLDVAYDLFEDSPERLLSEMNLAAKRGENVAMKSAEPARSLFATEEAPQAAGSPLDLTTASQAPKATAARDSMVVTSAGLSAQEMYDQGVNHLRDGNREAAYESFLAAYHSGEKLDNYRQQQLQDKLRELSPRRRGIQTVSNEVPATGHIDAVAQQRSVQFDKLRTDCLNAIFRAEKMRDKQPEQAVALLNQTLSAVQAADLSEEQAASLTAWVKSSRSSIEGYMAQQAPVIEMERKNVETKDLIEREIQTRVRVEQELATMVQKFNELMEQKRFAEANAVAKQAAALDPENPAVVTMSMKSVISMRVDRNDKLKSDKENSFWEQLQAVEEAAVNPVAMDNTPMAYPENWEELKKSRPKRPADAREHTDAEMRVRRSLKHPVSLHFNNAPLSEVLKYIADTQGINVMVDETGLTEEAVTSSTPISINVDGIKLESALNLMLVPLNLGFTIENEVLNVTSRMRKQGDLATVVYQVADLVVPVSVTAPVSRLSPGTGFGGDTPSIAVPNGLHGVPATPQGGPGFAQVPANPFGGGIGGGGNGGGIAGMAGDGSQGLGGPSQTNYGFEALTDLITTTVSPGDWQELGGSGSINQHDSTLSLVIRQTQKVHQEIADLLEQLRRLQDLQVTIEVRFITVSDQFFEQIGIDFDFNINDTIGGPSVNNDFSPIRPFGSTDPIFGGAGGSSSSGGGGAGGGAGGGGAGTGGTAGGGSSGGTLSSLAPFGTGPTLNMQDRDSWPSRTVVGLLNSTQQFTPNLDVPFRQGSFDLAAPTFGGFDPNAGIQFGMAILSDIEAFMFVRAAQGDRRSNVMFAPKVTLFNGQIGTVVSQLQRPFVVSLTPVASAFNIGYQPQIQTFADGTSLTVQAVVSADRRYVRLSVLPRFQNITDVFTFSYLSAGSGTGGGGGTGGGTGGGGIGGGGTGGGGGGGIGGGGGGGAGGGGNQQSSAAGTVTVQQPVINVVSVITVVSVPDGGTVLLGGVKSLREGRNMAGVPILNKIPYISRLFKNTGVGRETTSLMMMVTPRIIIQEEQEELLGIPGQ